MQISGISGSGTGQMQSVQAVDSVSKAIQNQIARAQKQLQELSSNKEMSQEDKMKKRQEIQKQIFELQNQLRQHEIELRQQARQQNDSTMEDMLGGAGKTEESDGAGMSGAGMKAMISAENAKSRAEVQGSVATRMEGRANILKSEIKLDGARGGNTEAKQGELADVTKRAMNATAAQISGLGSAVNEIKEAAEAEASEKQGGEAKESASGDAGETQETAAELVQGNGSVTAEYKPINVLV